MKKHTFFFIFIFISLFSIAQERYTDFGLKASLGFSSFSGMGRYEKEHIIPGSSLSTDHRYSSTAYPAWDFGFVLQHMNNRLLVQTEFTTATWSTGLKNAHVNSNRMKAIMSMYCTVSAAFGTKIPINENYRITLGVGPFAGYDFMSIFSSKRNYGIEKGSTDAPYDGYLDINEADYKGYNLGGIVLIGLEYQNMQFAINYYHGLTNIVKDKYPLRTRACVFSYTYFL